MIIEFMFDAFLICVLIACAVIFFVAVGKMLRL